MPLPFLKKEAPTTATPIPIERWFADITNVERLREIVSDPVFQQAAAILVSSAQPDFSSIVGTPNPDLLKNKQCWLAGYSDFARDLSKLTKHSATQNQQGLLDLGEWDHLQ
jgi:hypothetical protein